MGLAFERSRTAPAVYFVAKALRTEGTPTDPNAGTAGDGLAILVPSWARAALVFVTYAIGEGGNIESGAADAVVYVGAADAPLVTLNPAIGDGSVGHLGSAFLVANCGGVTRIGVRLNETGDLAHPGTVGVSIVFSQ